MADNIFRGMYPKHNAAVLKIVYAFVTFGMWFLYPLGLHGDFKRLERALTNRPNDVPVILLPQHLSHMDYILMTYVHAKYGLPLPCIVAGDNLNLKYGIGWMLRSCGAFFLRRSFKGHPDKDLYKAIFEKLNQILLKQGSIMAVFIEGGRQRTLKSGEPKIGVLKIWLDMVLDKKLSDIRLVPISPSYDKVVENDSYVAMLQGAKKKKENPKDVVRAIVSSVTEPILGKECYGRVHVGVGKPLSVRKYAADRQRKKSKIEQSESESQLTTTKSEEDLFASAILPPEKRHSFALSVGYRVLYEANRASVNLPTHVVGTILLLHNATSMDDRAKLVQAYKWLKKQCKELGGRFPDERRTNDEKAIAHVVMFH